MLTVILALLVAAFWVGSMRIIAKEMIEGRITLERFAVRWVPPYTLWGRVPPSCFWVTVAIAVLLAPLLLLSDFSVFDLEEYEADEAADLGGEE